MLRKCGKIFVILGDGCNLSCRYCIQHGIERNQIKTDINLDVLKWIDYEAELCNGALDVCFFGGEPLLYFDAIKRFVTYHKAQNLRYHLITNGKALTREMVDFFNSHNVYLTVSWDGENVKDTRGYDVFDEKNGKKDLLFALDDLCVTGVVSSKNYPYDMLKAMQKIDDEYYRIHRFHINVNTDFIFGCNLPDRTLADIDYKKLDAQVRDILREYDKFVKGGEASPCIVQWMTRYLDIYLSYMSDPSFRPYCQNGKRILNVDLKGNLYLCHNTREIIGTIYSRRDRYDARIEALEENTEEQTSVCEKCSALKACRIVCKLIPFSEREAHYCKLRRAAFTPVVEYIENNLAQYAKEGT